MDADLDTLASGLYVTSDDFLADNPQYRPLRPRVGLAPRLTDAGWSPWWCCRRCSDSPPSPDSCAMQTLICAVYFLICQHNRVTTRGSARRSARCGR